MASAKQVGNMQCSVCNNKKDTLVKREELVWQREDMIHAREKELREWELMLEEKNKMLLEKEEQLKFQEEKVGKTDGSGENGGKTIISNTDNDFSDPENENNANKNEFLLEKERIICEKENVISEMIENIEKQEKNILSKEKLLEDEKSVINKERKLTVERNHELDLREQMIKDAEEKQLNALFEAKKTSDDRITLVSQKENAVSMASEIIQNKEQALNERESMLIEKEKNILSLIFSLNKKYVLKEGPEENTELFERFDKIFNDRTRILQQKEKILKKNEYIIEDKWKNYYKAKDLMNIEEENLKTMKDALEKEKKTLREWEKLFQSQKNKTIVKCENSVENSVCSSSHVEQVPKSFVHGDINTFSRVEDKHDYESRIPALESREISGVELFQFYDKEKTLVQNSLMNENVGMPGNKSKTVHTENMLSETVQTFSDKVCVKERASDVKSASIGSGNNQLSEIVSINNRNEKVIDQEISAQNSIELDATIKSTLKSTDMCVPGLNSNEGRKEACEQEAHMSTSTILEERKKQIEINGTVVHADKQIKKNNNDNSAFQKFVHSCRIQKEENNLQNTDEISVRENERIKKDGDSSVMNVVDLDVSKGASRSSSISSVRSQSECSSVSGRNSPWLSKPSKKPNRRALLDAIKEKNFLDIVQILDSNCVSLDIRDNEGRSPLLLAVESGNIELVQRLISMGADIRACDFNGRSALHLAVNKNNAEMVHTLLKNSARLGVTDNDGKTALGIAMLKRYSPIIEIIHKYTLKSS